MNLRSIIVASACAVCALHAAFAQDVIAPLPQADTGMQRITPPDADAKAASILSTHPVANTTAAPTPLPAAPDITPAMKAPITPPAPFARGPAILPNTTPAAPTPTPALPTKSPFAHEAPMAVIPAGPHETVATPVGNVDAVEVSEPAPPTPVAAGADPAKEDPAAPTEFTSPMFDNATDSGAPRKIVVRVLNKVTAQSALYKAKPGDMIAFGRLQIVAEMCRVSAPNSQSDSAGLLDIKEKLPGKEGIKPLFHGWMYASSPSITGLEHPVYDVTMIDCEIAQPAPKEEPKPSKKADKAKKPRS